MVKVPTWKAPLGQNVMLLVNGLHSSQGKASPI